MKSPVNVGTDRVSLEMETMEPMKVARILMERVYRTEAGRPALLNVNQEMWGWDRAVRRWVRLADEDMVDQVMQDLEDAAVVSVKKEGAVIETERFAGDKGFVARVKEVVRCLEAITRLKARSVPCWLWDGGGGFNPRKCVAFEDVVVSVEGGVLKVRERDERWFSPSVVPVEFDPEMRESELWNGCMDQWLPGDEGGRELMRRWYGYLMGFDRSKGKALLQIGRVRSGKGTSTAVARALLGKERYHGKELQDLAGDWPWEGCQTGGVLVVSEFQEMTGRSSERIGMNLKMALGEDVVDVNQKYGKRLKQVRLQLAPWLCGNEVPPLSNKGQGIAGKLLPIKFNVSFLGKEDLELEAKLTSGEELRGIAMWALKGALALEAAGAGDRWPRSMHGEAAMEEFLMNNNILELFVTSQFVKSPGSFVENGVVRGLWNRWLKNNRVESSKIPLLHLSSRIASECSWSLDVAKSGGVRGLRGLAVRSDGVRDGTDKGL